MTKKMNILLCEDELIISLDLKRILKKLGYNVSGIYKSAEDVLDSLQKEKPDLVIADVNLKGKMNGIELAEILISKHAIKVMFITGSPLMNQDKKSKVADCDFIMKPFDEATLKEKLRICFQPLQST